MTFTGLRVRAARKGVTLKRSGSWVKVVDAKNKAVIGPCGGPGVSDRIVLLEIEDKISWVDRP